MVGWFGVVIVGVMLWYDGGCVLCALRRVLLVHLASTFSGLCCNMLFGCWV